MIVVLKKSSFGEMKVGLLRAIAFLNGVVFLGCSSFEVQQSRYCYYVSTKHCQDLEIVQLEDLADHHPLQRIGTLDNFYIALHHFVSVGQDHVSDVPDVAHHLPLPLGAEVQLSLGREGVGEEL